MHFVTVAKPSRTSSHDMPLSKDVKMVESMYEIYIGSFVFVHSIRSMTLIRKFQYCPLHPHTHTHTHTHTHMNFITGDRYKICCYTGKRITVHRKLQCDTLSPSTAQVTNYHRYTLEHHHAHHIYVYHIPCINLLTSNTVSHSQSFCITYYFTQHLHNTKAFSCLQRSRRYGTYIHVHKSEPGKQNISKPLTSTGYTLKSKKPT